MARKALANTPKWKSRLVRRMAPVATLEDVKAKCLVTDARCWEWQGGRHELGYGRAQHLGKVRPAHRIALELSGAMVDAKDHIDHLCRNPPCCNPEHLEAVSCRTNILRGSATKNVLPDGSFKCNRCGGTRWHRQVDDTAADGWLRRCAECKKPKKGRRHV